MSHSASCWFGFGAGAPLALALAGGAVVSGAEDVDGRRGRES
jgi:hypothetical protein